MVQLSYKKCRLTYNDDNACEGSPVLRKLAKVRLHFLQDALRLTLIHFDSNHPTGSTTLLGARLGRRMTQTTVAVTVTYRYRCMSTKSLFLSFSRTAVNSRPVWKVSTMLSPGIDAHSWYLCVAVPKGLRSAVSSCVFLSMASTVVILFHYYSTLAHH